MMPIISVGEKSQVPVGLPPFPSAFSKLIALIQSMGWPSNLGDAGSALRKLRLRDVKQFVPNCCKLLRYCFVDRPPRFSQRAYKLEDDEQLSECFHRDPFQGLKKLLDLFERDSKKFAEILSRMLRLFGPQNIDDIVLTLLLSPEAIFHRERAILGEIEHTCAYWLKGRANEWSCWGKDPEIIVARTLQAECDKVSSALEEIWQHCTKGETWEGDSFAACIATLNESYATLQTKEKYDVSIAAVNRVLRRLQAIDLTGRPRFKWLVGKLQSVLLNSSEQEKLFDSIADVIDATSSSSQKRRPVLS